MYKKKKKQDILNLMHNTVRHAQIKQKSHTLEMICILYRLAQNVSHLIDGFYSIFTFAVNRKFIISMTTRACCHTTSEILITTYCMTLGKTQRHRHKAPQTHIPRQ